MNPNPVIPDFALTAYSRSGDHAAFPASPSSVGEWIGRLDDRSDAGVAGAFRRQLGPRRGGAEPAGSAVLGVLNVAVAVKARLDWRPALARLNEVALDGGSERDLVGASSVEGDADIRRLTDAALGGAATDPGTTGPATVLFRHGFVLTGLCAAISEAKEACPSLRHAFFAWTRQYDPGLWILLCSIGRRVPFVDAAAVLSHFEDERLMRRPLPELRAEPLVAAVRAQSDGLGHAA